MARNLHARGRTCVASPRSPSASHAQRPQGHSPHKRDNLWRPRQPHRRPQNHAGDQARLPPRFAPPAAAAPFAPGAPEAPPIPPHHTPSRRVSVILNNLGASVAYLIIIGDVLAGKPAQGEDGLLKPLGRFLGATLQQRWACVGAVVLCVHAPLCCLRRIELLSFTSTLSVCLSGALITVTAGVMADRWLQGSLEPVNWLPDPSADPADFVRALPVLTTAYVCHYNVNPVLAAMRRPTQSRMRRAGLPTLPRRRTDGRTRDGPPAGASPSAPPRHPACRVPPPPLPPPPLPLPIRPAASLPRSVVSASLAMCSAIYWFFAVAAYSLFGQQTQGDVLMNYGRDLARAPARARACRKRENRQRRGLQAARRGGKRC